MLRFIKILVLLLLVLITASCSIERQRIDVQKLSDTGTYEDFKEITDTKKVSTAKKILHNAKWEKAKVDMEREADYQFVFQYTNPEIEAKAVLYSVWISPNKDSLEVVQEDSQYVHLSNEDSNKLFKAITETNLSDVK